MIYGQSSNVSSALDYITRSEFLFYLTGSRFFGTQREDSDYDFFIQWTDEIEKDVIKNGFRLDSESYAQDPVMVKVYKRDNVHIQLVNDAKMKFWVQHCIAPYVRLHKPNKEQMTHLWSIAIKLYRGGESRPARSKVK